jgi:hypothetical protein
MAETWRPERPRNLYVIGGISSGLDIVAICELGNPDSGINGKMLFWWDQKVAALRMTDYELYYTPPAREDEQRQEGIIVVSGIDAGQTWLLTPTINMSYRPRHDRDEPRGRNEDLDKQAD